MARVMVDIDEDAPARAAGALGTEGPQETVDAAPRFFATGPEPGREVRTRRRWSAARAPRDGAGQAPARCG